MDIKTIIATAPKSWTAVGYADGLAGKEFNPPAGARMSIRDSYRMGWDAGDGERISRLWHADKA